jgi:hypothetical protein
MGADRRHRVGLRKTQIAPSDRKRSGGAFSLPPIHRTGLYFLLIAVVCIMMTQISTPRGRLRSSALSASAVDNQWLAWPFVIA